jgi:hypothetical protein
MAEEIREEIQGAVDARIPRLAVQFPKRRWRRHQTLKIVPEFVEGSHCQKKLEKPALRAGFFVEIAFGKKCVAFNVVKSLKILYKNLSKIFQIDF